MNIRVHKTKIQLRFSDIDMLRHVNNAKFATFMETARMQYYRDLVPQQYDWNEIGLIIARLEFDFKIPVFLNDDFYVETWVSAIGSKSVTFDYRFMVDTDTGSIVKATGKSVVVCFHYKQETSIPVPQLWKDKINEFQSTNL
jgi:acyl-CoA thioester hydrolase